MKTQAALAQIVPLKIVGNLPDEVIGIAQDSRRIKPGWIFAARKGQRKSGLDYIGEAHKRGAVLVVTDEELPTAWDGYGDPSSLIQPPAPIPLLQVGDFRKTLVVLSHRLFDHPSRKLKVIGITGTNGKTSTTYLIRSIVRASGGKCGLMGTVEYDTGARKAASSLTTPDVDELCALLKEMVDAGCGWAVTETSSHALAQGRVEGVNFAAAGFTNLTQDHLDYHIDLEDYAAAKAQLFSRLGRDGLAVVNAGDPWGHYMARASRGRVITYGWERAGADLTLKMIKTGIDGSQFELSWNDSKEDGSPHPSITFSPPVPGVSNDYSPPVPGGESKGGFVIDTPLFGVYQGENIALAAGICLGMGIAPEAVVEGVRRLRSVPGRMEAVEAGQPFKVLVDYSHTPDALEHALESLKRVTAGRLIVVFGCGGNRDRGKRPQMGAVAARLADRVYITSDNPRFEEPELIIGEILKGVESDCAVKVSAEVDRREAIHLALGDARAGDVVLISGKGHESYQEVRGVRRPFDDRDVAREL